MKADRKDPREERLPKWARDLISRLRTDVVLMERLAEERRLASKPEESDAVLDPYDGEVGLGVGQTVRFRPLGFPEWRYLDVRVHRPEYEGGEPFVEIMAGGSLRVAPRSGNVIRLEVTR